VRQQLISPVYKSLIEAAKEAKVHAFKTKSAPAKKTFARQLRKNMSPPERLLWARLRANRLGIRIRRQCLIFGWIADFYCAKRKLIIEIDGKFHDKPAKAKADAYRDKTLASKGFSTIRFSANRVFVDIDAVVEEIRRRISPPKQLPGCRDQYRPAGGFTGKRLDAENGISVTDPRRGMMSRAPEACTSQG
jgi:very-short-patch-repair endonuclease